MLHSVGNTHTNWIYKFLSIKLNQIENLFRYLNKNKIKTFFVKDLYEYDFKVPVNGISLSFDDGYSDNWVYLFPLLEKYNIKGTIFVNPEFADPRDIVREKLNIEVNKNDADKALGFLSWKEMKIMEESGLVDIQSHSMSHTWYFTSPKLVDFYSPIENKKSDGLDNKYPWISWNQQPDKKPYTHNSFAYNSKRYGLPIFENGRSLGIRKFFPDEYITESIIKFTSDNHELFQKDWHTILNEKFRDLISDKKEIGRYETDNELNERYWYELNESKKILEKELNKEITILCWPGGSYNENSLRISEEAGYLASTISSKENIPIDNKDKKYKRISRKPMTGNVTYNSRYYGPSYFRNILIHRNYPLPAISRTLIKAEKLTRLVLNK